MTEVSKEKTRKALQKQVQGLVLKLRKEGKTEEEINKAKSELKSSLKRRRKRTRPYEQKTPQYGEFKSESEARRLGRKHDIVIIPIFWKKRNEETNNILASATELKAKLVQFKLNVWIDQRKSLMPGQKFKYWEELGVKWRAEIGPEEARETKVVLSRVTKPGEVARRWRNMPIGTAEDTRNLLKIVKQEGDFPWLSLLEINEEHQNFAETQNSSSECELHKLKPRQVKGPTGDSLDINYLME